MTLNRSSSRLILEVEIAERLTVGVMHDEAGIVRLIDGPRRWKTARRHVLSNTTAQAVQSCGRVQQWIRLRSASAIVASASDGPEPRPGASWLRRRVSGRSKRHAFAAPANSASPEIWGVIPWHYYAAIQLELRATEALQGAIQCQEQPFSRHRSLQVDGTITIRNAPHLGQQFRCLTQFRGLLRSFLQYGTISLHRPPSQQPPQQPKRPRASDRGGVTKRLRPLATLGCRRGGARLRIGLGTS